jgi:phosphatidyl-myo-inositol dimannoside synthase
MKISFLYTNAFSAVGGLQRFNRNFLKALRHISNADTNIYSCSLSDREADFSPLQNAKQTTAAGNKTTFLLKAFWGSKGSHKIFIGHIHLLFPLVILLRVFMPAAEIILITHGIEAWNDLSFLKKWSLHLCHTILAVSHFTREKLVDKHRVDPKKIKILPNTIDPLFQPILCNSKPRHLLRKFNLIGDEKVILTLSKVDSYSWEKGYDRVLNALPAIIANYPKTRYILAGKQEDPKEIARLSTLIEKLNIQDHVIIAGQLPEEEIASYYSLCDVFVLPSTKEGFGIVFLEAIASGKVVIAGNRDGSRDAVLDGKLGLLINPDNHSKLTSTIVDVFEGNIDHKLRDKDYLHQSVYEAFGFDMFCLRVLNLVTNQQQGMLKTSLKRTKPVEELVTQ